MVKRQNTGKELTSLWIVTGQEVETAHDWEQEVRCDWLISWGAAAWSGSARTRETEPTFYTLHCLGKRKKHGGPLRPAISSQLQPAAATLWTTSLQIINQSILELSGTHTKRLRLNVFLTRPDLQPGLMERRSFCFHGDGQPVIKHRAVTCRDNDRANQLFRH